MATNITQEVTALGRMTVTQLRTKHVEVFGEATRSGHKEYLVKRIAWRMQANEWGDLTDRAKRRAEELAKDADLRSTPPKVKPDTTHPPHKTSTVTFDHDSRLPMPGAILRREYKGREIVVRVLQNGFECDGQIHKSISALAKIITGTHWNGYHFFNLKRHGADHE